MSSNNWLKAVLTGRKLAWWSNKGLTRHLKQTWTVSRLLKDVSQSFHKLNTKYSDIEPYLYKCFEEIKEKFTGGKTAGKPTEEDKKEKLKTLLTRSIDIENTFVNYNELTCQTAHSVAVF